MTPSSAKLRQTQHLDLKVAVVRAAMEGSIRLCRSLDHVIPDSASALISLAAGDTRCDLIDLAGHYYGPRGYGANHNSAGDSSSLTPPTGSG